VHYHYYHYSTWAKHFQNMASQSTSAKGLGMRIFNIHHREGNDVV